jgi:blue copper oxidase
VRTLFTRRQFALGCSATIAAGFGYSRYAIGDAARFDTPLPIPKLIEAAGIGNTIKLRVASSRHAFVKGKLASTYGYSASVLGPVIRVHRGDEVRVTIENALDRITTVHWHGLLVPGDVDGGPHQPIKPGDVRHLALKVDQPAATDWFHPHPHRDTARQVYMGLTGMIIVDDGSSTHLALPQTYGADDLPIILQDRSFDPDGSLGYNPSPMATAYGSRGDTILTNGAIRPFAKAPRGLVRLRLLNGANARNFDLRFSDERIFHVIASDGGFVAEPVGVSQLQMSPGERYEILVDFADGKAVTLETGPDTEIGLFGALTEQAADGAYVPVMRFEPSAGPGPVNLLPTRLVEPAAADPTQAVARRRFVLDSGMAASSDSCSSGAGRMTINGKSHDLARIDAIVRLGTTEIWEIVSVGMAHPFHVHGASFRILSINGQSPPAYATGWKDVVLVEGNAELLVAFNRPATREHPFMFHCHILEHEDAGLMAQYICE